MAQNTNGSSAARGRRVQRLKKIIILSLLLLILIPTVSCVILSVRVGMLTNSLKELQREMLLVNDAQMRQQEEIAALKSLLSEVGESSGFAPTAQSSPGQGAVLVLPEPKEDTTDPYAQMRKVYLTFDDGPSTYTDDILDILDRYEVKATFFVVGKEDDNAKEAVRRIAEEGHTLGMHSYSHKYREIYASEEAFREDFEKIQEYIYEVAGVESMFYRFPGGSSNTVSDTPMEELAAFLETEGVVFFDWNISSGDAASGMLSVERLVKNTTKDLEKWDSCVILMHDSADKRTTVEALPIIIENILAMEDTVILPITDQTVPVQHIDIDAK